MTRALRVATRASALARWQAERVASLVDRPTTFVIVSTAGDRDTTSPIHTLGGTGVFVKEIQQAVLRGDADIAVHSAKDLPAETPDGLVLASVPERADPRDAFVGAALAEIPTGGRVGTGSVRRRAQLAALRPDLTFAELRGNIPTRLERAKEFDAGVVAYAALVRLGLAGEAAEVLEPSVMLPQVGQGALAVECRVDDEDAHGALAAIDDDALHRALRAERAFLGELGGGCNLPCGALATASDTLATANKGPSTGTGALTLDGLLASLDGRVVLRAREAGSDPEVLGRRVAHRLVYEEGGAMLLEGVA